MIAIFDTLIILRDTNQLREVDCALYKYMVPFNPYGLVSTPARSVTKLLEILRNGIYYGPTIFRASFSNIFATV